MSSVLTLSTSDSAYPRPLLDLKKPPDPLYVRGLLTSQGPRVGIVGARRASHQGLAMARQIAGALSNSGVVVVSGGALGIDSAAHRGALAGRASTVVVLPTAIDDPYPRSNIPLFFQIIKDGGAIISEKSGVFDLGYGSSM